MLDSATIDRPQVASFLHATRDRAGRDRASHPASPVHRRGSHPRAGQRPAGAGAGVRGKLGGVGARPAQINIVSDADGALVTLALALKLRPDAPGRGPAAPATRSSRRISRRRPRAHHPVPFMSIPVEREKLEARRRCTPTWAP
ncbi:MAG: DUF1177 family protein [Betaproteobacteria bacterium]|nr:DUF1177 family protein [Betaproteobacteria bacterium]